MRNEFAFAAFIVAGLLLPSSSLPVKAQSIDDIKWMTEEYPPFNLQEGDGLSGISIEILASILKRMNSNRTVAAVELLPWVRGYDYIQSRENTCLFSMTRTEEREKLFKWVGPICPTRIVVIAPKEKGIEIESVDDLKKYRIGVVEDDVGQLLLEENGVIDNLDRVATPSLNAKKLAKGRIDMWAYAEKVAMWVIKKEGFDPTDYEVVHVMKESELFYAFHKDTDGALIEAAQKALDEVRAEGELQGILDKYLK